MHVELLLCALFMLLLKETECNQCPSGTESQRLTFLWPNEREGSDFQVVIDRDIRSNRDKPSDVDAWEALRRSYATVQLKGRDSLKITVDPDVRFIPTRLCVETYEVRVVHFDFYADSLHETTYDESHEIDPKYKTTLYKTCAKTLNKSHKAIHTAHVRFVAKHYRKDSNKFEVSNAEMEACVGLTQVFEEKK